MCVCTHMYVHVLDGPSVTQVTRSFIHLSCQLGQGKGR